MRIAVDLMGGDLGTGELVPAVVRCLKDFPETEFLLVGDERAIGSHLGAGVAAGEKRISFAHTDDVVRMDDKPAFALRHRQSSSMYRAIAAVHDGEADGCVSSGNTGALMAIGRHILKTLPGIDRPAIIKAIPSTRGRCYLLDLGANINCSATQLVQFAAMGSVMCEAVEGIERPKVGLLNIGEEDTKGESAVIEAAATLKSNANINFIGFVEGDGIYESEANVLVCDGWVGNIALKTSEGLARFIVHMIKKAFDKDLGARAAALLSDPVLKRLQEDLSPENYNGATLLGLGGIVVKSHGSATANGFYHAIAETHRCIEQAVPDLLGEKIAQMV